MNYEYLASTPYVAMTFTAVVMMVVLIVGALFFTSAAISEAFEGKPKSALISLIIAVFMTGGSIKLSDWKEPSPDYEKVTARLTDSGFTRDEKSGKSSYVTAGYLAYIIEDGSNLIYYQRIGNGSVAAERIYLYKVSKGK